MLSTFNTSIRELALMQSKWASEINPVLALPTSSPSILQGISVSSGSNTINHKLGRKPIGWLMVDTNAAVTLYRSSDLNDLTLTLTSSGAATITLLVF